MTRKLENYVKRIVGQTDCSKSERADLYEEMLTHVFMCREEEIANGKSEEEAEEEAMKMFGREARIGDGLQQAIFPYRRELLLLLALLGFLFTFGRYTVVLVQEQTALLHILIGTVGHSAILFFALNRVFALNRKIWLALALLVNLLLLLVNTTSFFGFWTPGFVLMVLLNLYLLYRTVLTYEQPKKHKTARRVIHVVNITLGLGAGAAGSYIYFIAMAFGAPPFILLNVVIPLLLWVLLYTAQIYVVPQKPKIVLGSLGLSVLILVSIFRPLLQSIL